jgi:Flp pilus assembly protein TadD
MTSSTDDTSQLIAETVRHLNAGQTDQAESVCRDALAKSAEHPDAWHLLGVIQFKTDRLTEARNSVTQAIRLNNKISLYYNNLSLILLALDDMKAALEAALEAVRVAPMDVTAHTTLSTVHQRRGDVGPAISCLEHALTIDPASLPARTNLGALMLETGNLERAESEFKQAYALSPTDPETAAGYAKVLIRTGRAHAALDVFRPVTEGRPASPRHVLLYAEALLGVGRTEEALSVVDSALKDSEANLSLRNFRGHLLRDLDRPADAIQEFESVLAANPDHLDSRINLGLTLLGLGSFGAGWHNYRARSQAADAKRPVFLNNVPQWTDHDLHGARLAVWTEQGIGDEILQAGLVPDLAERCASLTLVCSDRLSGLFRSSFPGVTVVPKSATAALGGVDFACPLIDTAVILRPDARLFPTHHGYLRPDPDAAAALRRKYVESAPSGGPPVIVGLSWRSGNATYGRVNTIDLRHWEPVFKAAQTDAGPVVFVSCQYDANAEDAEAARRHGISLIIDDGVDHRGPLGDAAAQVAACDLILSTSTTTVQLAGALARPTLHLPGTGLACGWYWMTEGETTPWYPAVRQIRRRDEAGRKGQLEAAARAMTDWINRPGS